MKYEDFDYGKCPRCGYRFLTIVEAVEAVYNGCKRCSRFVSREDVSPIVRRAKDW